MYYMHTSRIKSNNKINKKNIYCIDPAVLFLLISISQSFKRTCKFTALIPRQLSAGSRYLCGEKHGLNFVNGRPTHRAFLQSTCTIRTTDHVTTRAQGGGNLFVHANTTNKTFLNFLQLTLVFLQYAKGKYYHHYVLAYLK